MTTTFGQEILLIELIQDRPFLYDKSLINYKDVDKKYIAWKEISKILNLSIEETQRAWKLLRERFGRERKKLINKGTDERDCPWPLYKLMSFMYTHISTRKRGSGGLYRHLTESKEIAQSTDIVIKEQPIETEEIYLSEPSFSPHSCTSLSENQNNIIMQSISPPPPKQQKLSEISTSLEETIGTIKTYLTADKTKPNKNLAFGQYVGLSLSEMSIKEQNYKRLKIIEILNEEFN